MSRISKAKEAQNYRRSLPNICARCKWFSLYIIETWPGRGEKAYAQAKEPRCTLGGFRVAKNSTCDCFREQEPEEANISDVE